MLKSKKKFLIPLMVMMLLVAMTGNAMAADRSRAYNIAFMGNSYLNTSTHVYSEGDSRFYDSNSTGHYYRGCKGYCDKCGCKATNFISPNGTGVILSSHRRHSLRFQAYSSTTSSVCTASGRYGTKKPE
jgi:hypothetical protein